MSKGDTFENDVLKLIFNATAIATIEETTAPLLRLKDDPVVDVQRGPAIRLWG